jgi:hypothetical protein
MMKAVWEFLKDISADFFSEIWTFVGLFSAWLVLTGSAKTVIGNVTLVSFLVWIVTLRLRNPKDKEE